MTEELSCYFCLTTGMRENNIVERTGGANKLAICPHCGIDSIIYSYPDFRQLYVKHMQMFHSVIQRPGKIPLYHGCGYSKCEEICEKILELERTN